MPRQNPLDEQRQPSRTPPDAANAADTGLTKDRTTEDSIAGGDLAQALEAANRQLAESYRHLEQTNQQLARERAHLDMLNRLARKLSQGLDLSQVIHDAVQSTVGMFGAVHGCLILLDDQGAPSQWGTSDGWPLQGVDLIEALREGAAGELLRTDRVSRIDDLGAIPGAPAALLPGRSALLAPLLTKTGTIGLLVLVHGAPAAFQPQQEIVLAAAAETIALAIQNARLYTQLLEAVAARERMTSLLVHDIRSPLMSTHASIEIARRAIAELEVQPFVHESLISGLRSVRNVIELTNDLLDVKRLQSAAPALNYQTVALSSMLADVHAQMQMLALDRQVAIRYQVDPESLTLPADARLLRRVLVNLIGNGLRFTPRGSTITLQAAVQGAEVLLCVEDEGPGVPPADRERIFLPFVQGRGESHRGTGLGLAFCREVVLAHGGRIWVTDRPEGGSRFCVLLPLTARPS